VALGPSIYIEKFTKPGLTLRKGNKMANQTYQLILTGVCAGQFVQNVFHYRFDDDAFTNRLLSAKGLVDGFATANKHDNFLDMVPDVYELRSIKARRITNGGGPEYVDVSLAGSPGTLGSGTQMSGAGPVVIWFTDGGPRRTGKTFLPGLAPANVDGGEITAATITTLLTKATAFRANFPTVGGGGVTVLLCVPRSNDPATRSIVNGALISKDVGKQRRRQLPV